MPMPQKIIEARAVAYIRATSRKVRAGMPQTSSISSGGKALIFSRSSSKPSVYPATNCLSYRSSSMMVWSMAFSIATSAPGLNCRWCVAWRDRDCRRGSATTSLAP